MDFGDALRAVKETCVIRRTGWNGKDMHLALQTPDDHSKMTLPYIYMKTADGHLVPWLASQTDLLADDWEAKYDINDDFEDWVDSYDELPS